MSGRGGGGGGAPTPRRAPPPPPPPHPPREPLGRRLAGLEFTAGKLPRARQMLSRGPLRDQHAPARIDQRRRNDVDRPGVLRPGQPLACCKAPWQCLYFLPDPHGHISLRPTLGTWRTNGAAGAAPARGSPI